MASTMRASATMMRATVLRTVIRVFTVYSSILPWCEVAHDRLPSGLAFR